jgi:hypothetical protein
MKTHNLKTWPEYFKLVKNDIKKYEFRKNDRNFEVGDLLVLEEFNPCIRCFGSGRVWDGNAGDRTSCDCSPEHGTYTGRNITRTITHILQDFPGLEKGYVILSLE